MKLPATEAANSIRQASGNISITLVSKLALDIVAVYQVGGRCKLQVTFRKTTVIGRTLYP